MDRLDDFDSFAQAYKYGDVSLLAANVAEYEAFSSFLRRMGYALHKTDELYGHHEFRNSVGGRLFVSIDGQCATY